MTTQNPDAATPPPASAPARPDNALTQAWHIVVAQRDPGTTNWQDTAGHQHGYVMFRWMQATNVTPPTFTVTSLDPTTSASNDSSGGA